eukprot:628252-Pyramimonas_sp.AAC.1
MGTELSHEFENGGGNDGGPSLAQTAQQSSTAASSGEAGQPLWTLREAPVRQAPPSAGGSTAAAS